MLDDTTLALLGDHEAAKRVTLQGKAVPCAHCGNSDRSRIYTSFCKDKKKRLGEHYDICTIRCACCTETVRQAGLGKDAAAQNALLLWKTRAPILSSEEIEMLEGMR